MGGESENGYPREPRGQRPCWLEVDLDAVAANVRAIRRLVGHATRVCAVVKADAYGLGAVPVARAALRGGAEWLAVARVQEGLSLRAAGLSAPVLLTAAFAPAEAEAIVRHGLTPTVVQTEDALALGRAAARLGVVQPAHIKVDTGLTRFGAAPADSLALARLVESSPSLRLEGLCTHFASADEHDLSFTREQLARFESVHAELVAERIAPSILHAANSAGALGVPEARWGMVRVGITLSGHYPSADVPRAVSLRPAVSLRARLPRVYDLASGTSVGYGRTYRAERPIRAALLAAGYADGVPRAHSNRASAVVRGRRAPLVGRVSMDQCVVDVTEIGGVAAGDEAVLFGTSSTDRAGPEDISLDEFAAWSGTIAHEALCRIGGRVPRLYRQDGRVWWGAPEAVTEPRLAVGAGDRWASSS